MKKIENEEDKRFIYSIRLHKRTIDRLRELSIKRKRSVSNIVEGIIERNIFGR